MAEIRIILMADSAVSNIMPPAIRKVGAGITLSPYSETVLSGSARIAQLLDARLTLIHTGASQGASEEFIRDAAVALDINYEKEIVWNQTDPSDALLAAAERQDVDLLVCGAFEGPSINRRRFLRPVARKLAESFSRSLLLLAHPREGANPFRHIVAITDFSAASQTSCCQALWLAEKDQVESFHIISIHSIFMDAIRAVQPSGQNHLRTRDEEEVLLDQFVASLPTNNISITSRVIDATTGFVACDLVESIEADLLVLPRPQERHAPPLADWALQVVPCSLWLVPESG